MLENNSKEVKAKIRQLAIKLLKEGWNQTKIAFFLGVSQGSISNWKKSFKNGGVEELTAIPQSGRPSRLSEAEKKQLKNHLKEGAEACGFTGNFWTQKRVSRLIKEKFFVEIKPRQCGNILKELNYVLKMPQTKSYEQNPQKVEEWKTIIIPEIKKKLKNVMP